MPDNSPDSLQDAKPGESPPPPIRGRTKKPVKILLPALAICAVLAAVWALGLGPRLIRSTMGLFSSASQHDLVVQLDPVFNRSYAEELLSPEKLLGMVGVSPVDPSRVLFRPFQTSPPPASDEEKKTGTDDTPAAADSTTVQETEQPGKPVAPADLPDSGKTPRLVETPIVVSKEPKRAPSGDEASARGPAEKMQPPAAATQEVEQASVPEREPQPPKTTIAESEKTRRIGAPQRMAPLPRIARPVPSAPEPKPESYQVPGSLVVNVQNYKGEKVKWALMVILDDSAAMAKKITTWEAPRLDAATTLVSKLPAALTPGSKMAVRDFLCKKAGDKKESALPPCLSHMLYSWADIPFRGLKAKLEQLDPGGVTNPCAAAAYSLKSDFQEASGLVARMLLVTTGGKKCSQKEVLAELDRKGPDSKVKVDVIALGIGKKRQQEYASLSQKSGGLFLKVEKPSDVDAVLSRYGSVLQTPHMKKMEVKGEKTALKIENGEEVTLAPGSYTISLPQISGLDASKRTIKNVKVKSGQVSLVTVSVAKGRLVVKSGTK